MRFLILSTVCLGLAACDALTDSALQPVRDELDAQESGQEQAEAEQDEAAESRSDCNNEIGGPGVGACDGQAASGTSSNQISDNDLAEFFPYGDGGSKEGQENYGDQSEGGSSSSTGSSFTGPRLTGSCNQKVQQARAWYNRNEARIGNNLCVVYLEIALYRAEIDLLRQCPSLSPTPQSDIRQWQEAIRVQQQNASVVDEASCKQNFGDFR